MQKKEVNQENLPLVFPEFSLLGFLIVSSLTVGLFVWRMPPQIPLFLSRPFGESQLASSWWILSIPILHFLLYVSSKLLRGLAGEAGVLANMFLWIQLFVGMFLLMALFYILSLVY